MQNSPIVGQRLVAVFLAGVLLFNFPLVSLVDAASFWFGVPATVAYLFGTWAALIALMAWILEGQADR